MEQTLADSARDERIDCPNCHTSYVVGEGTTSPVDATAEPGPAPARVGPPPVPPGPADEQYSTTPLRPSSADVLKPASVQPDYSERRFVRHDGPGVSPWVLVVVLASVLGVVLLLAAGGVVWYVLGGSPAVVQVPQQVQPMPPLPPRQRPAAGPPVAVNPPMRPVVPRRPAPQPVLVAWQAAPDPPPHNLQAEIAPKRRFSIPLGGEVLFPRTLSLFAAVGRNSFPQDERQLVDLATMKPAGTIAGQLLWDKATLSPDGQFLAGVRRLQRNMVEVYSFKTGKLVQQFTAGSSVDWVDFAASERLVTVRNQPGKIVELWSLKKGKLLATRADSIAFHPNFVAVSPGRRYLALFGQHPGNQSKISIYDLVELQEAGEILVPRTEPFALRCQGLAFSSDGVELAGLFEGKNKFDLRTWSMDKGEAKVNHALPDNVPQARTRAFGGGVLPLQWWPERKGWLLYGNSLIQYDTGAEVAEIPWATGPPMPRELLPGDRIAQVSGPVNARLVEVAPLPMR
jgi:hypothetical protein